MEDNSPFEYAYIKNGIFQARYKEVVVDLDVAERAFEIREKVCQGRKYPTFWDCREIKYWTSEARDFQSSEKNYRLMKAGAVLYTPSWVATTIINFFLKFNPPKVPVKFFTSEEKALQWLKQFTEVSNLNK